MTMKKQIITLTAEQLNELLFRKTRMTSAEDLFNNDQSQYRLGVLTECRKQYNEQYDSVVKQSTSVEL